MSFDPDEAARRARAGGCSWGGAIHHVEDTPSTQDLARKAAADGAPEGTTFVADEQSRGRGRQGRPWVAPRGSALLASVLLRPALTAAQLPPLALVVGLALHDALAPSVQDALLRIKWPNDLTLLDRKVAGVLVEASLRGERPESVIVGFGINLTAASLPPEIEARATCLQRHAAPGSTPGREEALGAILAALQRRVLAYTRHGLGPLLGPLRAADGTAGRHVLWQEQPAVARGIGEDGRLLLETPSGLVAASAGEVLFVGGGTSLTVLPAEVGSSKARCSRGKGTMQHRNAMNPPPPPPGQSPAATTVAPPGFEEREPDTQNDLHRITDPDLLAALEATPTERTPIPPPDETPTTDIRTLRSPPPERSEDEGPPWTVDSLLQQAGSTTAPVVPPWSPPLHDEQVRLARKSRLHPDPGS